MNTVIDWKALSKSEGYRSLKGAVIRDIQRKQYFGTKDKLWCKFHAVIRMAMNTSHFKGEPMESILNRWEKARTYDWVNYYTQHNFIKLGVIRKPAQPHNPRSYKRYLRKCHYNRQTRKELMVTFLKERGARNLRPDRKPRWPKWKIANRKRVRK